MNILLGILAGVLVYVLAQWLIGVWLISLLLGAIVGILVYRSTGARRL